MPLWKIAWRSIQRRSVASLLTTLSMALGVMLVVAVLLIVGVVDESFRSNSSLGYDTIVGPKGGQLQVTLNTVYYLSRPVNNLPFEFYRQFLPADQRKDRQASAGTEFEKQLEILVGEEWQPASENIVIPAGTTSARLRVPLLSTELDGPKDFTLTAAVTSKNTANSKATGVATIEPVSKSKTVCPVCEGTGLQGMIEQIVEPKDESPASTDTTPEAEAANPDLANPILAMSAPQPKFNIESQVAIAGDEYSYFDLTLSEPIDADVEIAAALSDGADGRYLSYLEETNTAVIPVSLGDYYKQYRVVGTTPQFFDLVYDRERNLSYEFEEGGGNFTGKGESGVFEAILGAKVARDIGIQVGDTIQPAHGAPDGKAHDDFTVVGILKSSGTPQDRGVFVNIDGFNLIPDHIREDGLKEVTALLVDTKDAFRSMQLEDQLSDEPVGQVVKPVAIIYNLFNSIVGPVRNLLLVITALICVVSGISILVSIYNSMSDRKQEIAVMRSLGAGRSTVMTVVLLESVIISLAGGLLGWVAGHGLIGLASHKIENETGVVVSAFQLAPPMQELGYLLGPRLTPNISVEIWLIPILVILAIAVGFMPALSAYRTDVAKALQSSP